MPQYELAGAHRELAAILLADADHGTDDEARFELYRRAAELLPVTRPMALLWEAKIEHARGNRAKAELWAKKALREDPGFAEAQQFIEELSA